ncbi:hypothetical protein [Pseudomonas sp. GD03746]|uniref:hypothetical protein n=1 Tax=Pseudomonas sp. GD03746 TaxID=2975378 RepID=UPI00244BD4E1|nr:hypothetical protein [Pseudomonas sp. GD03746]MDH1573168.1 hypothetical protein [Pseudomonas sp. GD03746]HEN8711214.1 hypothetical protein [Pseudomonas putida]HEN8718780.1 hypothetical protein [Pseudomonas putida]
MKNAIDEDADPASGGSVLLSMWMDRFTANALWRYVNHDDFLIESIVTVTPMPGGIMETTMRKFSRIEIIATGNVYSEVNLYPAYDVVADTKKLGNRGDEQILRLIEVPLPAARLRVTLPLASSYLRYRAQDQSVLSLEWNGDASYAYYYPKGSRIPTAVPAEYEDYYDRQEKIEIAMMPRAVDSRLQDLYIYMLTTESLADRHFLFHQQPQAYKNLAGRRLQAPTPEVQTVLSAQFSQTNFPEVSAGYPPADNAWFSHLVTPPGACVPDGGTKLSTGWLSNYKVGPERPWNPSTVASAGTVHKIAPQARIFPAGELRQQLGFVGTPVPGAVWSVAGDAGGRIVKEGSDHFYEPATKPPGILFSEQGETLIPAVLKSSYSLLPARTDVVTAAGGGASASALYVTTFVGPTHFIRFHAEGAALRLSCCYFNRYQEEAVLQPEHVKWHILAGNGEVSAQGIFTPLSAAPTTVTILMAEDLRVDTEWRFAVTIIPMPLLSLRDVMRLQQA